MIQSNLVERDVVPSSGSPFRYLLERFYVPENDESTFGFVPGTLDVFISLFL